MDELHDFKIETLYPDGEDIWVRARRYTWEGKNLVAFYDSFDCDAGELYYPYEVDLQIREDS